MQYWEVTPRLSPKDLVPIKGLNTQREKGGFREILNNYTMHCTMFINSNYTN